MGKPTGFLELGRAQTIRRPVTDRIKDFKEFEISWPEDKLHEQGARCMDCGVPTCHSGCPLGNLIPDWNDLVYGGNWQTALDELHRTNNFPDITGRVCPAPCEDVCILGIGDDPVTIKRLERAIIDRGFLEGWVQPQPPAQQTWKRVAVVGSGPAGLAAAQQLARRGHMVSVFEKSDRPGGLLVYGIPGFKMEAEVVERRVEQMQEEGVVFINNTEVGKELGTEDLLSSFDAVLLAGGAQQARGLPPDMEGSGLKGIHPAMDFLTQQNKRNFGQKISDAEAIQAKNKKVVVLGGGDTGSDCLGTAHRQGAFEIHSFELLPEPEQVKVSSSHEEGGQRRWSVLTKGFRQGEQGRVGELYGVDVEWLPPEEPGGRPIMREVPGSEFTQPVDLVLLAMGFTGPVQGGLLSELGVAFDQRGAVEHDENYMTSKPGIFVAGDMGRGASLVVWAIWEGREAAQHIHEYLSKDG